MASASSLCERPDVRRRAPPAPSCVRGAHTHGWAHEQAIQYLIENQGDPDTAAVSEVEHYCVWPGQACSYMVGKLEWLKLRAMAKEKMGKRFDIRTFHDAGLLSGPTPLKVLDRIIGDYARG